MTTALRSLRRRVDPVLLLILLVAFLLRMGWLAYIDAVPFSDAEVYFNLADRLASGLGYVDGNNQSTAFTPVGYPAALAALFAVFGSAVWTGELLNLGCALAIVALTYVLGRELYGVVAGRIAAGLIAAMPSQIFVTTLLFSEPLYTAVQTSVLVAVAIALRIQHSGSGLPTIEPSAGTVAGFGFLLPHLDKWRLVGFVSLMAVSALAFYLRRRGQTRLLIWAGAGFLTGYGVLVRPAALVLAAAVLLSLLLGARSEGRRAEGGRDWLVCPSARAGAIFVAVALLTVAPWVARNWAEIGYGSNTSTNGGINLLVGNHHGATGCFSFDQEEHGYLFLIPNEAERDRRAVGEVWDFVSSKPLEALALLPRKFDCTWREDAISVYWNSIEQPDRPGRTQRALFTIASNWYYYSLLFLGFMGTPAWFRRDPRYLLLPMLVGLTVLYYTVILGDPRYHEPLLPVFAVWAAVGILFVPRWWRVRRTTAGPSP